MVGVKVIVSIIAVVFFSKRLIKKKKKEREREREKDKRKEKKNLYRVTRMTMCHASLKLT